MRLIALLLVLTLSGCAPAPRAENLTSSAQASETQLEATADAPAEQAPVEEADSTEDAVEREPASTSNPSPTPSETKSSVETNAPKPTPTSKPEESSPSLSPNEKPSGYTAQEVATKNSRTACWVIVSGGVYDLTDWISRHPGGSSAILGLCGTDATEAFEGKHGGEARPSSILDGYYLAPLTN